MYVCHWISALVAAGMICILLICRNCCSLCSNTQIRMPEQFKDPLLYFLLTHHKHHQIIKAALNPKVSRTLLQEFGSQPYQFDQYEEHKISKDLENFTVAQIIQLRGNTSLRVKQCHSRLLRQTLRRKMYKQPISQATRQVLWLQLTQLHSRHGFYSNIKQLQIVGDLAVIIEKDIARTKTTAHASHLRELLYSFAKYNPYIGYCQGLNFIAAYLLEEGFTCEEGFFLLKYITEDVLMPDYYTRMNSVMAAMEIFYDMLAFTQPKIHARLKSITMSGQNSYISVLLFLFQEFVCLFSKGSFPKELVRQIWDMLLLEGPIALFKAGLALFNPLEHVIMQCSTYQQYMKHVEPQFFEISSLVTVCSRLKNIYISPKLLSLLHEHLTSEFEEKHHLRKPNPQQKKYNAKCNLCVERQAEHTDIFVFRQEGSVNMIEGYLDKLDRRYFQPPKNPQSPHSELVIGRRTHNCRQRSDSESTISQKHSPTSAASKRKRNCIQAEQMEQEIRQKCGTKLKEASGHQSVLVRSESFVFMQNMIDNASLSNLLDIHEIGEMF